MMNTEIFDTKWLQSITKDNFDSNALQLFRHQYQHNSIYNQFCDAIHVNIAAVNDITKIPYLPISFFKTHTVTTGTFTPILTFQSSGTSGMISSKHHLKTTQYYDISYIQTFEKMYGQPEEFVFLCLLPNYLEKGNSSLVYMANDLIIKSKNEHSGFYLNEFEALANKINLLKDDHKIILLGVTFALLDFASEFPMDLSKVIIMETGGMKGRKEEWTRDQVHQFLQSKWKVDSIHSEYGMTELLSQGYSSGAGIYKAADTLKILVREESDPFAITTKGNGCVNVIDLANVESCAFIATEDMGRIYEDDSFEILGRIDYSALRGCSLMTL